MAGILSFSGRYRILHLTWFAFCITFIVWFNFAPIATSIKESFDLTEGQLRTLAICNVALTVPARIVVGMILDRYGPRLTYSGLLVFIAVPSLAFALAQDFNQLVYSRIALSIVGCGFVIGIRMVAEWFDSNEVGLAEGIYGGWGNVGSAIAAWTLPSIGAITAFLAAGQSNWRLAIALTGIISAAYGVFYYFNVQDTPPGKVYQRSASSKGMEVTTQNDFWLLLLTNIPLIAILGVIAWRFNKLNFINSTQLYVAWLLLVCLYAFQSYNCWGANQDLMSGRKRYPPQDRYKFSQVALLNLCYFANFGAEVAAVSIFPAFFQGRFGLTAALAGAVAGTYGVMNIIAQPGGGLISDKIGTRKWSLVVLLAGMGIIYLVYSDVIFRLALPLGIIMTTIAAFFVMASQGATIAIVPLIKQQLTGQIGGYVGAYGNVGSIAFLTAYSLFPEGAVGDRLFFQIQGIVALIVAFLCAFFLKEPQESHGEGDKVEATVTKLPISEHRKL